MSCEEKAAAEVELEAETAHPRYSPVSSGVFLLEEVKRELKRIHMGVGAIGAVKLP